MLAFIKKTIFLSITGLAVYYLATDFHIRLLTSGPTFETIIIGMSGVLIGLFGIILSVKTRFKGAKESFEEIKHDSELTEKPKEYQEVEKSDIISELRGLKNEFSLQVIKHDKMCCRPYYRNSCFIDYEREVVSTRAIYFCI